MLTLWGWLNYVGQYDVVCLTHASRVIIDGCKVSTLTHICAVSGMQCHISCFELVYTSTYRIDYWYALIVNCVARAIYRFVYTPFSAVWPMNMNAVCVQATVVELYPSSQARGRCVLLLYPWLIASANRGSERSRNMRL